MNSKYKYFEDYDRIVPVATEVVGLVVKAGLNYQQAIDTLEVASVQLRESTYPTFSAQASSESEMREPQPRDSARSLPACNRDGTLEDDQTPLK